MKKEEVVIGIDVSKDSLEVAAVEKSTQKILGTHSYANSQTGFKELCAYVHSKAKQSNIIFVLEATGVYHENLVDYLYSQGKDVSVVLPTKIKNYTKVENIKTKNDKVDARVIARYGCIFPLKLWKPMTGNLMKLRSLSRQIIHMKKDRARCKTKISTLSFSERTPKAILDYEREHYEFLSDSIEALEYELKKLAFEDDAFRSKIKKVATIKGISDLVAIQLVSELNGFELIENGKQLASYAGLDVVERQSGTYAGKTKISKKGNRYIRHLLYMPAMVAATHGEGKFVDLYQRVNKRNEGVCKNIGMIAVVRKLLIMVYTIWRKNEIFDPNYQRIC